MTAIVLITLSASLTICGLLSILLMNSRLKQIEIMMDKLTAAFAVQHLNFDSTRQTPLEKRLHQLQNARFSQDLGRKNEK